MRPCRVPNPSARPLLPILLLLAASAGSATAAALRVPWHPASRWATQPPLHPAFAADGGAALRRLIQQLPKAELHLHIEGTLEVDLMFKLAARNGDFLKLFSDVAVLQTEEDFYELAAAYLERAAAGNVTHAELHFAPQGHTVRGVPLEAVHRGLSRAIAESPVDASLILSFERHLSESEAAVAFSEAQPYMAAVSAVGLAGSEVGNPPGNFADLVAAMAAARLPITLCPLSNLRLQVYAGELEARVREVLASGIAVTINSDDPAYFGSYIDGNYEWVARVAGLGPEQLAQLAAASFEASFLPKERKAEHVASVWAALNGWRLEEREAAELRGVEEGARRRWRHAVPRWLRPAAVWLTQRTDAPLAA
ncbi:adenosine deaminase [Raphidocelis subcapitata]|uniref:Adenosine deaminase n=1 Tax=Raphidocelis subcapitata TaxID=307507 RepID=A0A2V0P1J3_9CHLO|nr:adenosine deaminase [Raphidocelis subcapitata]|eukprot:GBF93439.1 adenosine deaminase [Raphidocelis subcapitata]